MSSTELRCDAMANYMVN